MKQNQFQKMIFYIVANTDDMCFCEKYQLNKRHVDENVINVDVLKIIYTLIDIKKNTFQYRIQK